MLNLLSIYTLDDEMEWNKIVGSFTNHDVYYLSSYVKGFKLHGDGEPLLIYFSHGDTRAMNVVMKRDVAESDHFKNVLPPNTFYDFSTPYGYGGWVVEGNGLTFLEAVYSKFCSENNIVSEFVRFHPVLDNGLQMRKVYETVDLGPTVQIDLSEPEAVWLNLSGKNRNQIRKAKKLGVSIEYGFSNQLMQKFKQMYTATMDGQGADPYYYFLDTFFTSIVQDLGDNVLIFYALYEVVIISMALIIFCNGQMHYHLSGSDRTYRNCAGTNLLLYEAALWGSYNGFKTFHLGGGVGGQKDSLYKFKRSFNPSSKNVFRIGKKIFNGGIYKQLVDLRSPELDFDPNSKYFPLYRA